MNILFLSLIDFNSIEEKNIYTDLLREFRKHGHAIYIISPVEKRKNKKTRIIEEENAKILKIRIGNIQKTNSIEKGISMLMIESQYKAAIKKHLSTVKFDLVLYTTPPITIVNVVKFIKKRDNCLSYLLLKDIFPQNAVDLEILSPKGVKRLVCHHFRNVEKKLYSISDYIGCMSQANMDYILKHNPEIEPATVDICPNSVEVIDMSVDAETRKNIRDKYNIPLDKQVFVYGGNLGKPQGIDFMIECLKSQTNNEDIFFLIVGDGTEFGKIEAYINNDRPRNVRLMKKLPKKDYDIMVGTCDVGMIFLDHRFTIPNFPSRLLSYMQAKIPVLAVTDSNTDIGKVITSGGFGWWCRSDDINSFNMCIDLIKSFTKNEIEMYGINAYSFLKKEYDVKDTYKTIIEDL